jgi:hypothetical protein
MCKWRQRGALDGYSYLFWRIKALHNASQGALNHERFVRGEAPDVHKSPPTAGFA